MENVLVAMPRSGRGAEREAAGLLGFVGLSGRHNELAEAGRVARHFATTHHELLLRPDAAALLGDLMWHMDEPVADPAALPTYLICRFARQHVPVVLTGEGGDELLGGYPRYAWFALAKRLQRLLPAALREGLLLPLSRLAPLSGRYQRALENVLAGQSHREESVLATGSVCSILIFGGPSWGRP